MSVLATVGIAALAALGAMSDAEPEAGLCSVHPSALAELSEPMLASWAGSAPQTTWCTEADSLTDPRCHAQGQGSRAPSEERVQTRSGPDGMPAVYLEAPRPPRVVPNPAPARRPVDAERAPPFRPPRS